MRKLKPRGLGDLPRVALEMRLNCKTNFLTPDVQESREWISAWGLIHNRCLVYIRQATISGFHV